MKYLNTYSEFTNESFMNWIKKAKSKLTSFGKSFDKFITGEEEGDYDNEFNPDPQILMLLEIPKNSDIERYAVFNGLDASNTVSKYSEIFYSFKIYNKSKIKYNLKNTTSLKIAQYNNDNTYHYDEFVIKMYDLLDSLEVDSSLYGYGEIEKITPQITIFLKFLNENSKSDILASFKKLIALPAKSNSKHSIDFNLNDLETALENIESGQNLSR